MPDHLTINPWVVSPSGIAPESLDADAVRAVERLTERGHEAYFVGGCVRDILVGRQPKDFDIATAARPQQVKRTFPRNCRIIGRRFKLAHLHYFGGQKILEVSTFRRTPDTSAPNGGEGDDEQEPEDLLITHDNEFGSAEEDAVRRDFTINALFFDQIRDRIIDYVDGMRDVQARVIRTIGEPVTRFREDPIRILRAAKFAGRLGFSVDPPTFDAMRHVAPDLRRSAPPRVLEEILRLLRGGHAFESFQILRDVGALGVILPVIGRYLDSVPAEERVLFWRTLEALDSRVHAGDVPTNAVLLGAIFYRPVQIAADAHPDASPTIVAEELLGDLTQTLRLPRRDTACVKRICGVQPRFRTLDSSRFRPEHFARDPFFPAALELFELSVEASGEDRALVESWRERSRRGGRDANAAEPGLDDIAHDEAGPSDAGEGDGDAGEPTAAEGEPDTGERRPRRRRRGRRRRGGRDRDVRDEQTDADDAGAEPRDQSPRDDDERDRDDGDTAGDDFPARDTHRTVAEGEPTEERRPSDEADGDEADGDEPEGDEADGDATATARARPEATDDDLSRGGRRKRRRGGRRRRGRRSGGDARDPETRAPSIDAPSEGDDGDDGDAPSEHASELAQPEVSEAGREANAEPHQQPREAREPRDRDEPGREGRGRRGRRRRGKGGDRRPEDRPRQQQPHQQPQQQAQGDARPERGRRGKRRGRDRDRDDHRSSEIETVEPPPVDRSYLANELDPKDVPTFGALLEGGRGARRKRPPRLSVEDELGEPYKPPPHRKDDDGPPPPPPPVPDDGREFGDW